MPSLFESLGLSDVPAAKPPEDESRTVGGTAKDSGISLLKGAISVPESVVGLADLVTGGRAGEVLEGAGFRPKDARAILDAEYSPAQKRAFNDVQAANGFVDTLGAAVTNPSVVAHSVLESLPLIGAGGVVARGGMVLAPGLSPIAAAAIGEGVTGAGSAGEQYRQETPDGHLTGTQALAAGASGVLDAALALGGGKLAQRLGIADIDTMLAGGKANPEHAKSLVRRVIEGAVSEGVLEELPQSVQEQVLQNHALGKPLDEGVDQAAVLGMLSGAAMGGAANVAHTPVVPPITGPMSRAANAAPAAAAGLDGVLAAGGTAAVPAAPDAAEQPAPIDPVLERIKSLQGQDRTEAMAAYGLLSRDDTPKGVRQYNSRLLDELLAKLDEPGPAQGTPPADLLASNIGRDPVQGALAQQRDEDTSRANLENWMARAKPLALDKAQELQGTAAARGLAMEVVPHGSGQGFTVVPADWMTPAMRNQSGAMLPLDTAPTGVLRADTRGNVAAETGAQRIDAAQEQARLAAERQRKEELGLTPDIEAVQAGVKRAPLPTVQPGDVTLKSGDPFKNKGAAVRAQKTARVGDVLQVQGGWVVRQAKEVSHVGEQDGAVPVAAGDAVAARADGTRSSGDSAGAGVAGERVGDAAAAPAASSAQGEPVRDTGSERAAAVAPPADAAARWNAMQGEARVKMAGQVGVKESATKRYAARTWEQVPAAFRPAIERALQVATAAEPTASRDQSAYHAMSRETFDKEWVAEHAKRFGVTQEATRSEFDLDQLHKDFIEEALEGGKKVPNAALEGHEFDESEYPLAAAAQQGASKVPAKPKAGDHLFDEKTLKANRKLMADKAAEAAKHDGFRVPEDVRKVLEAEGATPASDRHDVSWTITDGLKDVQVRIDPATGKATIVAEYVGKAYDERTAEGAPAIAEAIQRAKEGLEAGRQEMAKRVAATRVEADKKAVAAPGAVKIEDFGEKLAGARKEYAALLKDALEQDVAKVPLSKAWPEPDYAKLLAGGADPFVVAFVHAARDEVPTKPQKGWKLKQWTEQVSGLRTLASRLLSGSIDKAKLRERLAEPGFQRIRDEIGGRADLYERVGHGQSLKGVRLTRGEYSMRAGETFNPPKVLWAVQRQAKASAFSNWPTELAVGDTREAALDAFAAKMKDSPTSVVKKVPTFDLWREGGKVHVGKKLGREYVSLKTFEDVAAARKYRDEHLTELGEQLDRYRSTPFERRAENAPRVGEDHRMGTRVTPEAFHETFGFRGVQFGNYVENSKRQDDLNRAYDALMDLAAVLGLPPKALSLDGQLGLAFGARGRGGKGAPAAHFERGQVVINLTKESGAGSLAHEWFHGVDNYFARLGGKADGMMTAGAKNDGVRPEMVEAFQKVIAAIKSTQMQRRSLELDKRKAKPYWSTNVEMAARGFESYIVAKLQDQSASNDYLANIVGEDFWNAQEALLGHENEKTFPYPTETEMGPVREAFDAFLRTVDTKETPKGVAMFKRGDGTQAALTAAERVAELQKFVDAMRAKWTNAPEIIVVRDMADERLPAAARQADQAQQAAGSEGVPHGLYYGGKAYIIASSMDSAQTLLTTIAHEVLGHHGLRGMFGDALKPIKQQIVAMRRKEVLAKAEEYGMPVTPEAVRAELGKGATDSDVQRVVRMRLEYAAEEVLAEMAQTTPTIGYVQRAIAAIRNWLREHVPGFAAMNLSDKDIIQGFIIPARAWVVNGEDTGAKRSTSDAVMFSRGPGNNSATVGGMSSAIMQRMNDTLNVPGRLNWWHKSVGTMYNLAQRSPQFKTVFDSVQDFLHDVSSFATEAADLAPKILPKLESWRDIGKAPISPEDNKAISGPIFEGTLLWGRDEKGKPVKVEQLRSRAAGLSAEEKAREMLRAGTISENVLKMWQGQPLDQYEASVATRYDNQMLRAGVVWTDDELRDQFKLSDSQVALYKEFRASVDRSITNMAVSDMLRFGGDDISAVRQAALDAGDVDAAALILRDHVLEAADTAGDRKDVLLDTAERMIEKADKARELMDRGYAPLSRFGHYTVDVVDESGERVYFGMFENPREAARMARKMQENYPKAVIQRGTVSDQEYKLFAGVSPETVELFGELLGLEAQGDDAASKAFQTYVKVAKANRSAMKRLIERKGIAGFSEDVGRVLAGFVYSNARQTSQNLHMGRMTDAASKVNDGADKGLGELKDAATKLVDYVKNPVEEAQGFRGLLFAQYLGGSVASAMVNMLQPVQVTFPYLTQWGGVAKAAAQMTRAIADVKKKSTGDAQLDAALKKAEEEGVVAPQEVHQLQAQASGRGVLKSGDGTTVGNATARASNALSRLTLAWGKLFGVAEQFNRRVTFIAAYRTAVDQGIADPAAFAEKAIAETQFIYNKGNKPQWARGAIGSTLFTFKQYSVSYVELLHRMATQGGPAGRRATLVALGMLFLFSGAGGLPGAEDVDDVIDAVMQRLGYNFSSKLAKKQFFQNLLGKELGGFAEHGLSGLPGVPIDVAGRLGMGNLIPGTGLLVDKQDHTKDVTEIAGAAGDFATRAAKAANKLAQGELFDAAREVAPRAAANAARAAQMYSTGVYKDDKGRKVIDVDAYDALAKAAGFQPTDVSNEQERTGLTQQLIGNNKLAESHMAERWAKAVADGDQAELEAARAEVRSWNEKNPDTPIRINRSQIAQRVQQLRMSKEQRVIKSAPKEIRSTVARELAPA